MLVVPHLKTACIPDTSRYFQNIIILGEATDLKLILCFIFNNAFKFF